jgi:ribonuclease BN (tRNA processing enzyme)
MTSPMRLTVLGSGTCVPSLKRNAPGALLEAADQKLLVDCGSGTLLQLERAGGSYRTVDAVFITHTHPDHVTDLVPLLHALDHTPDFERTRSLRIVGPPAVRTWLEQCAPRLLGAPRSFALELVDMPSALGFGALHVSSCPTRHTDASLAYRFEHDGRALVLTGDAEHDDGLVRLARGADLLVADCSFPDELRVAGHMTASDCGRLATAAGVKHLVLSHLYPTRFPEEHRLEQARAEFSGTISIAEDLAAFEV